MPLHNNNLLLVNELESMALLDSRFTDMKLMNYDSAADTKRGCLSLVFKAYDVVNQKNVALKFYDLERLNDVYRVESFEREHEILSILLNQYRCLQLASAFSRFALKIPLPNGTSAEFPCSYFAVDWVENDLDEFFLNNSAIESLDKLYLFNEIVLAIEALHQREVFHRDIKQDNLRFLQDGIKRVVVAIDLGTAARFSSLNLRSDYSVQPGAIGYSAPEARCGLSGNRYLSHFTDKYALGCLLYELFNKDFFCRELVNRNPAYEHILSAMTSYLHGCKTDEHQFDQWKAAISKLGTNISPVKINGFGCNVPHGIAPLLNEVLEKLTHHNFASRPKFEWVRARIWSAIRILENEERSRRSIEVIRIKREARQLKAQRSQAKLNKYLGVQRLNDN